MKIAIENFILEQSQHAPSRFDVYKKTKRTKGKNIGDDALKLVAYAVTLDSALDFMTSEALFEQDDLVSLKEFVQKYKEQREIFQKQLI